MGARACGLFLEPDFRRDLPLGSFIIIIIASYALAFLGFVDPAGSSGRGERSRRRSAASCCPAGREEAPLRPCDSAHVTRSRPGRGTSGTRSLLPLQSPDGCVPIQGPGTGKCCVLRVSPSPQGAGARREAPTLILQSVHSRCPPAEDAVGGAGSPHS